MRAFHQPNVVGRDGVSAIAAGRWAGLCGAYVRYLTPYQSALFPEEA